MSNENETTDAPTSVEAEETAATDAPAAEAAATDDAATDAPAAEETPAAAEAADAEDGAEADDAPEAEEPSVGEAASLLMGISTPREEDHASMERHERDGMSDAELLALGTEPDVPPGGNLVGTFVGLVVLVIVMGVGTMQLYRVVNDHVQERQYAEVDPELSEVREAARAVLTTPGRVTDAEGNEGGIRSTLTQGMDILVSRPNYLGAHPMGSREEAASTLPVPEEFAVRTPPRVQPAVPANADDLAAVPAEGSGSPDDVPTEEPGADAAGN